MKPVVVFSALFATFVSTYGGEANGQSPVFGVLSTNKHVSDGVRLLSPGDPFLFADENEAELSVPMSEFGWWYSPAAGWKEPTVQLLDGTVLAGQIRLMTPERLLLESRLWQPVEISPELVSEIRIADRVGPPLVMGQFAGSRLSYSDRLVLNNGDTITGKVTGVDRRGNVGIQSGSAGIQIPLSRIDSVQFARQDAVASWPPGSGDQVLLTFMDQTRVTVHPADIASGSFRIAVGSHSIDLRMREGRSLTQSIRGIQKASPGRFLSSFQPRQYRHEPLLGNDSDWRANRSFDGSPIRAGNLIYPFGIGMNSRSSLVFGLPDTAGILQFGVGMDSSSGEKGSVICKILLLDEHNQWRTVWTSPVVRGGEKPSFAQVDLEGGQAIALTVDYADQADVLDRLNWIMPQVIPRDATRANQSNQR